MSSLNAAPGVGHADPFRPPSPTAVDLNFDGKLLYRQGKWEQAREKYRSALVADRTFLAPHLNIACSFVRQERFSDAVSELGILLAQAHVPWAREIQEAADLGALKVRPETAQVQAAVASSARAWSADLDEHLLFIARTKPALNMGEKRGNRPATTPGVYILGLHQEVFAWSPRTGRYRPLTAEDGRVVAMARSADGKRLAYLTAEKLVRPEGKPAALRGIVAHTLDLGTMQLSQGVRVDGDVWSIALGFAGAAPLVDVRGDQRRGTYAVATGTLDARPDGWGPGKTSPAPGSVMLTANGVAGGAPRKGAGPCPFIAHDRGAPDGTSFIEIVGKGTRRLRLTTRFGAGLGGLPLGTGSGKDARRAIGVGDGARPRR